MPNTITSQYMLLPVPVPTVDPGPQYATDLNSCLSLIDQHDHSTGKGTPITPSGININQDLPFNGFNATTLRTSRYSVQVNPLSGVTDIDCVYVSGVDLYYNDGNGNQIQITKNGSISGSAGTISGLVPPASLSYVSGTQTFVFQSTTATAANIDAGSVILRNIVASSNGITLSPPSSLPSNYTITFPSSLPSSAKILTIDQNGNIAANMTGDNTTITVASSTISVKAGGIGYTQLSPLVYFSIDTSTTTPGATDTQVIFTNVTSDTASGYRASSGLYIIPSSGLYTVQATIKFGGTSIGANALQNLSLYKASTAATLSAYRYLAFSSQSSTNQATGVNGVCTERFLAGDKLAIYSASNISAALDNGASSNYWQITRIGS